MSELSVRLGKRLRAARQAAGLSQEALAERCGLHPTYIGQVERGEKNATVESVSRIARGLGVSLSSFFELIDDEHGADAAGLATEAYDLFRSIAPDTQEKLIIILRTVLSIR